jgi:hypothetical protein
MRFIGVILAVFLVGQAQAASVTYSYQGQDLQYWDWTSCIPLPPADGLDWQPCAKITDPGSGLWGSITFDTDFIPGGTLANSDISFYAHDDDASGGLWFVNYTFTRPGVSESLAVVADLNAGFLYSEVFALKGATGWVYDALNPWLAYGYLNLSFDSFANVDDWSFNRLEGGMYADWDSSTYGDYGGLDYYSIGPGAWTKSVEPSPVPLPASLPLLAGGLGLIAAARKRRRAA